MIRRKKKPDQPGIHMTLPRIVRRIGHTARVQTVLAYASRKYDPLRLRYRCGRPWIAESVLAAWITRTFGEEDEQRALPRVTGKEALCKAFGRDWRTILRYAAREHDPLPLHYSGDDVWIYQAALVDWVHAHDVPYPVHVGKLQWLRGERTERADVVPRRIGKPKG